MPQPAPETDRGAHQDEPPKALPPMRILAGAALLACVPIVAVACIAGSWKVALGAASGTGVCIALYAFLRGFVAASVGILAPGSRESVNAGAGAAKTLLVLASIAKFFVMGLVLWVIIALLKANIFGFIAGFVFAQIAITVVAVRHLTKLGTY